jgi:WD40 repeat protein
LVAQLHGSHNKTATIWDLQKKEPIGTLIGHDGSIFAADFFGSSSLRMPRSARTWCISDLTIHWCFSAQGRYCVTGSLDNRVMIWDLQPGPNQYKPVRSLSGHTDSVTGVKHIKDDLIRSSTFSLSLSRGQHITGQHLRFCFFFPASPVTSSADHKITIWSIQKASRLRIISAHNSSIPMLGLFPGGLVISGAYDQRLKFWSLKRLIHPSAVRQSVLTIKRCLINKPLPYLHIIHLHLLVCWDLTQCVLFF